MVIIRLPQQPCPNQESAIKLLEPTEIAHLVEQAGQTPVLLLSMAMKMPSSTGGRQMPGLEQDQKREACIVMAV